MIVLLSPSKNLHNTPHPAHRYSAPRMTEESEVLIENLKKLKPEKLQKLMEINSNLATLNYNRYHSFSLPHSFENATAAIYTFRGEVYLGFEANTMNKAQAEQADKFVRILSGLYGVLRPLDLIQPYRLEMGTELKVGKTKDLYGFWGNKITDLLNADIAETKSKEVINLASQEYMGAVNPSLLKVPIIDIQFLEDRNGKLQFLSYNAKRSRGWMARYIVDNKISKSSALKGFDLQGYSYREELSDPKKMVFVR
ncbi:MAG TPA: peroxide stress protein YaaA [Saprospiraceae bacterium]